MINYADYDFYTNEYKGSLSVDLFNSLIIKASREIDKNVNKDLTETNIKRLTDRDQYRLKYTVCELVDYFNANGSNSSSAKANSIQIDGVSKNKNSKSENKIETDRTRILNNLPDELTRFL